MKNKELLKKMTSRKFLLALAGFLMGLFTLLRVDKETSIQVVGLIVSGVSIGGYLFAEGTLDYVGMTYSDNPKHEATEDSQSEEKNL